MRVLDKVISNGIFRVKFILFVNPAPWSKMHDLEMLLNIFIDSI